MITVIILASILSVLTVAAWYSIGTLQEKMWSRKSK